MTYEENKRVLNIRKPFTVFVGMIVGILLAYFFVVKIFAKSSVVFLIIISSILLLLAVASIVCVVLHKYGIGGEIVAKCYKYCKEIILMFVALIVAVILAIISLLSYVTEYNISGTAIVTAVVENITEYEYGYAVDLCDVKVEISDQTYTVDHAKVYVSDDQIVGKLEVGTVIKFDGDFGDPNVFNDNNFLMFVNGNGCVINVDGNVDIIRSSITLRSKILNYVKSVIYDNMSKSNGILSYSMLFGDTNDVNNDINLVFSIAGVSHLLAVSGLHVGVIAGLIIMIINWICNKKKVSYLASSIVLISIVSILLLFYAYLCGFSPSVCRASIMVMVYLVSKSLGKKYDILNSLSIAGIIILTLWPLQLFNAGFQLSFLCIFAIITLVLKGVRVTNSWHIPAWISAPLLSSLCINLVTMPIVLNVFGSASLWSVIANIFVIPLFGFVYPVLFVCTLLSSVFGFLSFILFIPDVLMQVLYFVITIFASLPGGIVESFRVGYLCLALIILLAYIVKFLMCSKTIKYPLCIAIVVACIVSVVVNLVPVVYSDTIFVNHTYSDMSMFYSGDNGLTMVGTPNKYTKTMLRDVKVNKLDSIVLNDFNLIDMDDIDAFAHKYGVSTLLLPDYYSDVDCFLAGYGYSLVYIPNIDDGYVSYNGIYFSAITYNDKLLGYVVLSSNTTCVYISTELSNANAVYLSNVINDLFIDCLVSRSAVNVDKYDINASRYIFGEKFDYTNAIHLSDFQYCVINYK